MVSMDTCGNFTCVTLENDELRLKILPELGSKIISVYNKKSDREWLEQPVGSSYRKPVYGSRWEEWDRSGWDELFPSIDGGSFPHFPWEGHFIPDHGELWAVEWDWAVSGESEAAFTAYGTRIPYQLSKRVSLERNRILFRYRLQNLSRFPLAYLWAPHPILRGTPELQVELPESVSSIVTTYSTEYGGFGQEHEWPVGRVESSGHPVDFSRMPALLSGSAHKFYAKGKIREGWAQVRDTRTNDRFRMEFDPEELPYLAVWVNGGGWHGAYHVALEPAAAYMDDIRVAHKMGAAAELPALGCKEWSLSVLIFPT